ncbi:MAG: hypothetical protein FJ272_12360, partial [Planctomycetes bacterium]|nr:hypothetical protein [Planctomycetota bacterium]
MEIEARGPVTACVRFEGPYMIAKGGQIARHITRVEVFAGQAFAKVTHTLVLTEDTNKFWLKDIGWQFAFEPGADVAVFGVSRSDWQKSIEVPLRQEMPTAYMLQDQHYYFAHGTNHFQVAKADRQGKQATVLEGEECGDWAALMGGSGGLMVACREAARQHPKEFEMRRDGLTLHLFSTRAGEELDFRGATLAKKWDLPTWYDKTVPQSYKKPIEEVLKKVAGHESNAIGWSKTHELMISPLAATTTPEQAARLARLHSAPVMAIADPAWICRSEAMGAIHPKDTARFPEAEQAIEAAVRYWNSRVPEWGDYGFVDYYAGPMLSYQGKYPEQYRYRFATYTLRPDLWLLYARSGDRAIGEFAMGTNRAFSDGNMAHWDGPRKTRGLFIHGSGTDIPPGAVNTGMLPFYWQDATTMHISSASNLNCYAWDYYLTGYRRAKDIMLEYADGVKRTWSPAQAKRDERALALMRMLVQSYAFTWDPALRAMAEATMDTVWKADSETGLFQKRSTYDNEERNTMYKTQVDVRGLIEAWGILGEQRYYDCAMKVARYWWQEHLVDWPLFYCNPVGVAGSFLYRQTGDARYAQGLAVQVRHAASAYDPEKKEISGVGSAEKTTFLFEGVSYAGDVLTRSGADKGPLTSWIAYEDFGFPSSIVVKKSGDKAVQLDVHPPRDVRIAAAGKSAEGLPWLVKGSYTKQSLQIPANAAAGEYEIRPEDFGLHGAVADSKTPLVLYAPGYWRPSPSQAPNVRYHFKLPDGSKDA